MAQKYPIGKVLPRAFTLGFLFCANLATARRAGPSSWSARGDGHFFFLLSFFLKYGVVE